MVPAIAQKVHVDGKSSTVHQVMTLIESQTGYKFFYNNQVNLSRMVSIKAKNESLTSVLKRLFDGTNVSYKIIDKTIVLEGTKRSVYLRESPKMVEEPRIEIVR